MKYIRRTIDFSKIIWKEGDKLPEYELILWGIYSRSRAERYIKREYHVKDVNIVNLKTWTESRKMSIPRFIQCSDLVSKSKATTMI